MRAVSWREENKGLEKEAGSSFFHADELASAVGTLVTRRPYGWGCMTWIAIQV